MTDVSHTSTTSRALPADAPVRASSGALSTLAATGVDGRSGGQRLSPGEVIGRYVVLSELGAGAMGVVYAAYDPDLDRRVALKLMATSSRNGPARLLREAQALAQLGHPNVVAVHDVGLHAGGVFVAMELIEGQTLRQHLAHASRRWREVAQLLVAAGQGLVAAHAQGLVHRDFKPDNVMVDSRNQRVRVMDFGLARFDTSGDSVDPHDDSDNVDSSLSPGLGGRSAVLTAAGAAPGTPAYMAAEQWLGEPADAASDQFAFCVTAWEALLGRRPFEASTQPQLRAAIENGTVADPPNIGSVPTWLLTIIRRGLLPDATRRWPSMTALLAAIRKGQTRAGRRRWQLAVVGVAAVGATVVGKRRLDEARTLAACHKEGDAIEQTWRPQLQPQLRQALSDAMPKHGPEASERIGPALDDWVLDYKHARTQRCLAPPDAVETAARLCFAEREAAFEVFVERLLAARIPFGYTAVETAARLASPSDCVDPTYLSRRPTAAAASTPALIELHRSLASARGMVWDGDAQAALTTIDAALVDATQLDSGPIQVQALLAKASVLAEMLQWDATHEVGLQAYRLAATLDQPEEVATATILLAELEGKIRQNPDGARPWLEVAQVAVGRAHDPHGFVHADYLATLAIVELVAERPEPVRDALQRLLAIRTEMLGPNHPDIAATYLNMGYAEVTFGQPRLAIERFEIAIPFLEAAIGPQAPIVGTAYNNLAMALLDEERLSEAEDKGRRAVAIAIASRGPDHPGTAMCQATLGYILMKADALDEAIALSKASLTVYEQTYGSEHPHVATVAANVGEALFLAARYGEAEGYIKQALAVSARSLAPNDPDLGELRMRLGQIQARNGQRARARDALTAAIAVMTRDDQRDKVAEAKTALAGLSVDRDANPDATSGE